ncbi:MAG: haloacid dehalogenase [Desulfobacterales bacterium]|nr:haloacid dehalogenase [Desulfobacterales bacterium]
MIQPESIAFDFDGVCADTMKLFIDIARDEFDIHDIYHEDITSYDLQSCTSLPPDTIEAIAEKIVAGQYRATLNPIKGAATVLKKLEKSNGTVLFVTARPSIGPVAGWITDILGLDPESFEVIPTGSFEGKVDVLQQKGISYFIEDRLETCFTLQNAGIFPVVFKQPWNRSLHPFIEVGSWNDIEALINF